VLRRLPVAFLVVAMSGACSSGGKQGLTRQSGAKTAPSTTATSAAGGGTAAPVAPGTQGAPIRLTSSSFTNGGALPGQFTCQGANQSPPLAWSGVPAGTVTLALRLQDIDTSQKFIHWLVFGIKPTTTSIAVGQPPSGATQAKNSFGQAAYTGPCPPAGQRHHYVFTLLAMSTDLKVSSDVSASDLWATVERSAVVGHGELTATYQRPAAPGTTRKG
jgi:Raf kinase inhibitor-like YbhB/YbcL family protein